MTVQEGGHRLCLRTGELRLRNDKLPLTAADSDTKLIRRDDLACAAVVSLIDGVSGYHFEPVASKERVTTGRWMKRSHSPRQQGGGG